MHDSVMTWAEAAVAAANVGHLATLEVGSCDVNGSVRGLFTGQYVGVDIAPGPGVDDVYDGEWLPFERETFDCVISTEMFEHARRFWITGKEMVRVLKRGGWLILSARGNGFGRHNPPDRWRFMPGTLTEFFGDFGLVCMEQDDPQVPGVFILGRKP